MGEPSFSLPPSLSGSCAPSESGDAPTCRICWNQEDDQPGGRIRCPCRCTTGVHDRCLLQWLLSGRENQECCELCTAPWEGELSVAIRDLLAAAAALKAAQPDAAQLVAAAAALHQREAALQRLLQEAAEAEAARQRDFERMRRVAAADREVVLGQLEQAKQWRRSNLRWLPPICIALAATFLAGVSLGEQRMAGAAAPAAPQPARPASPQ